VDYFSDPALRLHNGKFTDGDPAQGISPSFDPARFNNAVFDELLALITAGGLTPAENNLTQVRQAVINIVDDMSDSLRGGVSSAGDNLAKLLALINLRYTSAQSDARYLLETNNLADLTNDATARNNLGVYSTTQTDQAISTAVNNVINGAPGALDTLNELAAAINDNSSYAATVTASLSDRYTRAQSDARYLLESNNLSDLTNAGTARNNLDVYSRSESNELMPVGTILSFADESIPTGFLSCTGAAISRTTFAQLYSVIGTRWGSGDGIATFNLPDLRNEFLRGSASGRLVGSFQSDELRAHAHALQLRTSGAERSENSDNGVSGSDATSDRTTRTMDSNNIALNAGGAETRPRNRAVNFIIRY